MTFLPLLRKLTTVFENISKCIILQRCEYPNEETFLRTFKNCVRKLEMNLESILMKFIRISAPAFEN